VGGIGGCRRLSNEELHNLYASPYKGDEAGGGACNMHGKDQKCIESIGKKTRRKETTW
jgi:hypothetical protein